MYSTLEPIGKGLLANSFNRLLFRSVGDRSSGRDIGYDDKQMIINPIYGSDEANEIVSIYIANI